MTASLEGRKLLVTGGDSGIGLAFVRSAVAGGARVRVIIKEDSASLDGLVAADARFTADLGNPVAAANAATAAIESLGGDIDGLAACAGVPSQTGARDGHR